GGDEATGGLGGAVVTGSQLALSRHPAHDADCRLTGVAMFAVDVTGTRHHAQMVRRTNERYRSLAPAGNQGVWVTGPSGQVTEDSPEGRWITGQSIDEYLAGGWLAAVHPDERKRIAADWLACVAAGTVFDGSYRVRAKTGSCRHYDVRAVPIER